ncbi:MAG TPA: RNA polymerase sigma factor SigJ [Gaiellaceae bacterium]|jgi:RNA polymerase sigma-70 factor (ECF subfamily)|nr:RNA polymerase sigma factor SigJ [Gaiellaceae bacterium]
MTPTDMQTAEFERSRAHLQAVAYRMLGSTSEAEDAVQEAWLRLSRSDAEPVENLGGWLTTVVARVCLDMLRARRARREDLVGTTLPEPIVRVEGGPEDEAVLADSVGLALLVVLDTLTPPERLAFVLHDMFGVAFDEIAEILDRSEAATRQLASRARRRVRGATPQTNPDLREQRRVVDAFLAASRAGDFEALLEVLDPEVVLRADVGPRVARMPVHGAEEVARTILERGSRFAPFARPAIVNGNAGVIVVPAARPTAVVGFSVARGRIIEIDLIADPAKIRHLRLG